MAPGNNTNPSPMETPKLPANTTSGKELMDLMKLSQLLRTLEDSPSSTNLLMPPLEPGHNCQEPAMDRVATLRLMLTALVRATQSTVMPLANALPPLERVLNCINQIQLKIQ